MAQMAKKAMALNKIVFTRINDQVARDEFNADPESLLCEEIKLTEHKKRRAITVNKDVIGLCAEGWQYLLFSKVYRLTWKQTCKDILVDCKTGMSTECIQSNVQEKNGRGEVYG